MSTHAPRRIGTAGNQASQPNVVGNTMQSLRDYLGALSASRSASCADAESHLDGSAAQRLQPHARALHDIEPAISRLLDVEIEGAA